MSEVISENKPGCDISHLRYDRFAKEMDVFYKKDRNPFNVNSVQRSWIG